jgi:hypothetical protein
MMYDMRPFTERLLPEYEPVAVIHGYAGLAMAWPPVRLRGPTLPYPTRS